MESGVSLEYVKPGSEVGVRQKQVSYSRGDTASGTGGFLFFVLGESHQVEGSAQAAGCTSDATFIQHPPQAITDAAQVAPVGLCRAVQCGQEVTIRKVAEDMIDAAMGLGR